MLDFGLKFNKYILVAALREYGDFPNEPNF